MARSRDPTTCFIGWGDTDRWVFSPAPPCEFELARTGLADPASAIPSLAKPGISVLGHDLN